MSLSKLYDDIVAMATVNRSCPEIIDICSAVEEMLERLVSSGEIVIEYKSVDGKYNTTLKFQKAYLQTCGSMGERTSLWKSVRRQGKVNLYIEFDYLAVFCNPDNMVDISESLCEGCRKILTRENKALWASNFNKAVHKAMYTRIRNMCSCGAESADDSSVEVDRHDNKTCDRCTVSRDTGCLQIAWIPDFSPENIKNNEHCSLVLYWISSTYSLLAPNVDTLQLTEKIKRLVIRIDTLTAFEFPRNGNGDHWSEIKRYIIAKECPYHLEGSIQSKLQCFMVSQCMHELNAIRQASENHKQSFVIIKFLCGQFSYVTGGDDFFNTYHAKVAFLIHLQTCTDDYRDCATCIIEILQSLVECYPSRTLRLPEFHPLESIRIRARYGNFSDIEMNSFQINILCLKHVMSQLKTDSENKRCGPQYRPYDVVNLIKWTCRILCEEGQPGILDVHGRLIVNTESALNILGTLLEDRELCYSAVAHGYSSPVERKLCRDLPDPESERGVMYWRVRRIAKMIITSDPAHIMDETIQKAVKVVQDYVQKERDDHGNKQLQFLTISRTVSEMSNNDQEQTSHYTSCFDSSPCSRRNGSIFDDDLQLNWSALTEQQTEGLKQVIRGRVLERQEEKKRLADQEREIKEKIRQETRLERDMSRPCCCILI